MTINKISIMAYAQAFLLVSYYQLQKCKFLVTLQKICYLSTALERSNLEKQPS